MPTLTITALTTVQGAGVRNVYKRWGCLFSMKIAFRLEGLHKETELTKEME